MCFTETWLHQDILDNNISISGFQTVQADWDCTKNSKHKGGELAIQQTLVWPLTADFSLFLTGHQGLQVISNCFSLKFCFLFETETLLNIVRYIKWHASCDCNHLTFFLGVTSLASRNICNYCNPKHGLIPNLPKQFLEPKLPNLQQFNNADRVLKRLFRHASYRW